MEQNKDQSGAITLERAGFKLELRVIEQLNKAETETTTETYVKDGVYLERKSCMGRETWNVYGTAWNSLTNNCFEDAEISSNTVDQATADSFAATMGFVNGKVVTDAELALAELASEAHSNGNDWNLLIAPLVERVRAGFVSARAADAPSEPSESPRLDTEQSREYLVSFMERHFTDTTFHRYIRGQIGGSGPLAGDFAWQMARALRRIEAGVAESRAADALDSQPTEPDGLPPLPEPIEVGGEGWDSDDFKSEKTFSCEHMWAYARAAIASSQPTDGGVRNG